MALEQWASTKVCGIQQRAPPIFDRGAITMGIDPHSSFLRLLVPCGRLRWVSVSFLMHFIVSYFILTDLNYMKAQTALQKTVKSRNMCVTAQQ